MSSRISLDRFVAVVAATLLGLLPTTAALFPATAAAATVLRVPQDFSTIQSAIDAAVPGDTVLVAAGTYNETIDFQAKAITVMSESGAAATIIDGGGVGVVVTMAPTSARPLCSEASPCATAARPSPTGPSTPRAAPR